MKHLSNLLLNQYLDRTLSAEDLRRVETHLNECPVCLERLEELHTLAFALKAYREETIPKDLTPSILRQLPERRPQLVYRLLLIAQGGISAGVVVLLLSTFDQSRSLLNLIERFFTFWPVLIFPGNSMPWPTWSAAIQGLTALTDWFLSTPGSFIRSNQSIDPGILFPIRGLNLLLIGLVVILLWILGNTALLVHRTEVRK